MNGATTKYSTKHSGGWDICHNNDNLLTITPFAICMGNCPLASSAQACILHLFQASILRASSTQHSHSSVSTMLGPEWFFKPYTKAYNTPSNKYSQVRQSLSEYLNVITSSPLFQESTHPGVAPALCSTLGTTPYFSVSISLLVVRVQVALHL